jgi:hypothetical protein
MEEEKTRPRPVQFKEVEKDATPFEREVMRYLRNLAVKFHYLAEQMQTLQATVLSLGHANGTAYKQVKTVINELAESTSTVVDDLSCAMGTMRAVGWDDYEDLEIS